MGSRLMSLKSKHQIINQKGYSARYRVLHWTMAIGCILLLMAGQQFNFQLTDSYRISGLRYHSSIGSVVLLAAIFLLVKRFIRRDPRPSVALSPVKKWMATGVQLTLYSLAVFIPVTGLITAYYSDMPTLVFGVFDISQFAADSVLYDRIRRLHELATLLAIALVASHGLAALYHHFVKKDDVLTSMIDLETFKSKARVVRKLVLKS